MLLNIYTSNFLFLVADEGHILKNAQTALAKCLSKIRTSRRIVLTGTPLQNNLIE
jgi:SNF2 family DNA or RNA helicase